VDGFDQGREGRLAQARPGDEVDAEDEPDEELRSRLDRRRHDLASIGRSGEGRPDRPPGPIEVGVALADNPFVEPAELDQAVREQAAGDDARTVELRAEAIDEAIQIRQPFTARLKGPEQHIVEDGQVSGYRLVEELALRAERVVEARPRQAGVLLEVFERGRLVPPRPEQAHGGVDRGLRLEFAGPPGAR